MTTLEDGGADAPREGGCQCGAVRYRITGAPKTVVVCHCASCQKQSGSAFGMTMVLAAGQFALTAGTLRSFTRTADSGARMTCSFCPDCGTRIVQEKEGAPGVVLLKPGTLDDTSGLVPTVQLWTERKQGWLKLPALRGLERQP
jgi:hypothetical protein